MKTLQESLLQHTKNKTIWCASILIEGPYGEDKLFKLKVDYTPEDLANFLELLDAEEEFLMDEMEATIWYEDTCILFEASISNDCWSKWEYDHATGELGWKFYEIPSLHEYLYSR